MDNRHPERLPGAAVRQFGISNLKSTSSQSRDSGEEVSVGLGLNSAKCLERLGGFKIAAGGQKKTLWRCRRLHKPLKRDVMTDAHAPQSQLRLWLIFVLFYFFFLSIGSKASKTCHPTLYAHRVILQQCACLTQHRAIRPGA